MRKYLYIFVIIITSIVVSLSGYIIFTGDNPFLTIPNEENKDYLKRYDAIITNLSSKEGFDNLTQEKYLISILSTKINETYKIMISIESSNYLMSKIELCVINEQYDTTIQYPTIGIFENFNLNIGSTQKGINMVYNSNVNWRNGKVFLKFFDENNQEVVKYFLVAVK